MSKAPVLSNPVPAIRNRTRGATMPISSRTGSIRRMKIEITEWLSLWLQTPNLFNDWVELRQRSPEFRKTFGQIRNSDEQ